MGDIGEAPSRVEHVNRGGVLAALALAGGGGVVMSTTSTGFLVWMPLLAVGSATVVLRRRQSGLQAGWANWMLVVAWPLTIAGSYLLDTLAPIFGDSGATYGRRRRVRGRLAVVWARSARYRATSARRGRNRVVGGCRVDPPESRTPWFCEPNPARCRRRSEACPPRLWGRFRIRREVGAAGLEPATTRL